MKTCADCAQCDTSEHIGPVVAGVCTLYRGFFNGRHVLVWMAEGCPDYTPAASAQGDGDQGSEAA
jgi:hypothetical protein